MSDMREKVVAVLAKGALVDRANGKATTILARKSGVPAKALSSLLRRMELAGEIVRDTSSRRTYSISLAPAPGEPAPEEVAGGTVDDRMAQLGVAVVNRITALAQENEALKSTVFGLKADLTKAKRDLDARQLEIASLERRLTATDAKKQQPIMSAAAQKALETLIAEAGRV